MSADAPHGSGAALDPDDPRVVRPSFRSLLERFDVATVVFDGAGVVTYASPLTETFAGRPAHACIGVNVLDFVDPDDTEYVVESLAFALAHPDRTRQPLEVHFPNDSGRRLCEIAGQSFVDDPDIQGVVITIRDITLERTLESILDAAMDGGCIDRTLELVADLVHTELRGASVAIRHAGVGTQPGGCIVRDLPAALGAVAGDAPADARTVAVERLKDLPAPVAAAVGAAGYAMRWRAPLTAADGRHLGELTAWFHDDTPPSPSEKDGIVMLARTAAFAVDRWQRDRLLEFAATHDGLTGLANRTVFEAALDCVHRNALADTGGADEVVLFVDLDGFKAVNDRHGHLVGDHVLVRVAGRLRTGLRDEDLLGRLGGDEFAVLLRGTSAGEAAVIADRLLRSVTEPIEWEGGTLTVGVSIGLARLTPGRADGAAWLDAADGALRAVKAAGKNGWRWA